MLYDELLNKSSWLIILFIDIIVQIAASHVQVELKMPRFVECGNTATFECQTNMDLSIVYKIEWLKNGVKMFQYIKERSPPFISHPISGGVMSWNNSSDKIINSIRLINIDYAASGEYSCVVSVESPIIYTKESQTQELTVFLAQSSDPKITFEKPLYYVGETMVANCTSSKARPPPHITWLINGHRVPNLLVTSFSHRLSSELMRPPGHVYKRTASSTSQLQIEVSHLHATAKGQLFLTCMATIPGYLAHGGTYADARNYTAIIDVVIAHDPTLSDELHNSSVSHSNGSLSPSILLFLILVVINESINGVR